MNNWYSTETQNVEDLPVFQNLKVMEPHLPKLHVHGRTTYKGIDSNIFESIERVE